MNMMSGRYMWLQWLIDGYAKTGGMPLIGYTDGQLVPFNAADDIGIYYCIPKLAYAFSLSLDQTIYLFFYGIAFIAGVLGAVGFWLLYRTLLTRSVAIIGLFFLVKKACITEVYCVYAASNIALLPLWLYVGTSHTWRNLYVLWALASGIIIGFVHYVRAYAGLPPTIFILCMILASRFNGRQRCALVIAIVFGWCLPYIFFTSIYDQYVAYAIAVMPEATINLKNHVIWHTIYLGFGFLNNNLGIMWDDAVAAQKVAVLAPEVVYTSPAYENILKWQVWDLVRYHSAFVIRTIAAKLGVLCIYVLLYANIGLAAAWYCRKPWYIDGAFFLTLCVSTVFGLIAIPDCMYALSLITCALLYALVSINSCLER